MITEAPKISDNCSFKTPFSLGNSPFNAFDRLAAPTTTPRQAANPGSGEFEPFIPIRPTLPNLTYEEIKRAKIDLIAGIGQANSIRDFGGLWGVHGLYLLQGAKALGCCRAEMVDATAVEEFQGKVGELQAEMEIQVDMKLADFRNSALYKGLSPVDVSLLYEVVLHQDNAVEVIKNVTSKTAKCVCVAQPVLKEELFKLPAGCANLQFYSEELKDLLRYDGWWHKEPPSTRFETRFWMWGQSISWFESIFYGYGWEPDYTAVHNMSDHWDYALMRFVPRDS